MQLMSDLVLLLAIGALNFLLTNCILLDIEKKSKEKNSKSNKQIIIYDPQSKKEIDPLIYFPTNIVNKKKPYEPSGNLIDLPQFWNPCTCLNFSCACCLGIRLSENFDHKVCILIEYNAAQISIELRINYNKRTIAQFGFSARNPPAYCIPILLPLPVFGCVRLYDIRTFGNGNVQICIAILMNVFSNTVFEFNFACLRFGVNGVRFFQHGQLEMDTSLEEDDDEMILKGDGDEATKRQNIILEENYSGISVEAEEDRN